jgi:hypothetical protein
VPLQLLQQQDLVGVLAGQAVGAEHGEDAALAWWASMHTTGSPASVSP